MEKAVGWIPSIELLVASDKIHLSKRTSKSSNLEELQHKKTAVLQAIILCKLNFRTRDNCQVIITDNTAFLTANIFAAEEVICKDNILVIYKIRTSKDPQTKRKIQSYKYFYKFIRWNSKLSNSILLPCDAARKTASIHPDNKLSYWILKGSGINCQNCIPYILKKHAGISKNNYLLGLP